MCTYFLMRNGPACFIDFIYCIASWQLGSRITSVRIVQMIEHSLPFYIMVDGHPRRHDPLHIVTHRIQSKITEFTNCLMKTCTPCLSSTWKSYLQALEMTVCQPLLKLYQKFFKFFFFIFLLDLMSTSISL